MRTRTTAESKPAETDQETPWPVRLFRKSVLKQRKFREVTALLGDPTGLRCLDLGGDNGVISYLLRQRGGRWASADIDVVAVQSISSLVGSEVYELGGVTTPFPDDEFDCVVIVDLLEHLHDDAGFIRELFRILRPGGRLIVNVPHARSTLLRRIRFALGQTDKAHGHIRPGYTTATLHQLLGDHFRIRSQHTYSKVFSELVDTGIRFATDRMAQSTRPAPKGTIVTADAMQSHRRLFRAYSLAYWPIWLFSRLDTFLPFASGCMLIADAVTTKEAV